MFFYLSMRGVLLKQDSPTESVNTVTGISVG